MPRGDSAQTVKATLGLRQLLFDGEIRPGERLVELNEQFHDLLVALSKSEIVARELVRVEAVPFASPSALLESHVESEQREILLIAQHQHRAMIEAIEEGHGARAEEVAREHARISQRSLDLALKRGDVIERLPGAPLLNLVD
jgi:GntR family transcriptional regulator, vanillate catabolism transcriptional regulator